MLLDLTLPDGDGRDVCRELRKGSDVPIIMLTARGTVTDRVVGLEMGADDYVVKPFAVGEVISRIRAVLRRTRVAPGRRAGRRDARSATCASTPARGARGAPARSFRSRARSSTCSRGSRASAGRVVSRETLMSDVWDENWFGSTKTLDVHIAGCAASSARSRTGRATSKRCAASASAAARGREASVEASCD